MKNILRFILIIAAILLLMFACAVMADGPKPPYASPFSQSLFTNTTQAGWQSALGVGGGGTTNANTARALYYPSVSAYPLVYTNIGGQPDSFYLPLPLAQQAGTGDYSIPVIIPTPFASTCGGFFFPMFTTNFSAGAVIWSILPNGTTNYLKDLKSFQIGSVPEQSIDIGPGTVGMFLDPNYCFQIGGFLSGKENDWIFQDPTNWVLHFPVGNSSAGQDPRSNGWWWHDVLTLDQRNGIAYVSNLTTIGGTVNIGVSGTNSIFKVNALQWSAVANSQHLDGSVIDATTAVTATNFLATKLGSGAVAYGFPNGAGWGENGSGLRIYNVISGSPTLIRTLDTGPNTERFDVDTDIFPATDNQGSLGDSTHHWGLISSKSNSVSLIQTVATITTTNALSLGTGATNSTPANVTVGVTAADGWGKITNNGVVMVFPMWTLTH